MRRDFKQLLMVIKTIAMLNQHHRERSQEGDIIADLSDYKWARELLAPIFRSIVTGGLTETIRKTCEVIAKMRKCRRRTLSSGWTYRKALSPIGSSVPSRVDGSKISKLAEGTRFA